MTTPLDIINLALLDAGITGQGQTARPEDANNAFKRLNWMLAEWQRQRWLVYHLVDISLQSTGAVNYTVGPGGDFDTGTDPRPERLEAAFFRQLVNSTPQQVDYPLRIIPSMEDYSTIALKTLQSWPQYAFLDSAFPLANLRVYPVPQASLYSIHLIIKATLPGFTSISQDIVLPEEYMSAMYLNLAVRLVAAYQLPQNMGLENLAKASLSALRGANTQISTLRMPRDLMWRGQGNYNVFSDQNY